MDSSSRSLLRIFFVFFVLVSTVTALGMEISSVGGDQKLGRKVEIFAHRSDVVAVLNGKDNGLLKVRQLRTSENAPPSPQGNRQPDPPQLSTTSTTPSAN